MVYAGSLERIDFGEEGEPKGFCWVELERGRARWEFVPVNARPFRTVHVDARQCEDPTEEVLQALQAVEIEGAVVRVLVQMRSDQQPLLRERELQAALAGAASVSISRQVEVEARARLGEGSAEALTPLQLVERYLRARGETSERLEALLTKAEECLRDTR